jgi:hypothetical protein
LEQHLRICGSKENPVSVLEASGSVRDDLCAYKHLSGLSSTTLLMLAQLCVRRLCVSPFAGKGIESPLTLQW